MEAAGHYLGLAVVEIRGQEAVGEVAFDEARRREFLQAKGRGTGERTRRSQDPPNVGLAEMASEAQDHHPA